ncbi:MAG: SNF2-related protein [Planctomycetota bacterium]
MPEIETRRVSLGGALASVPPAVASIGAPAATPSVTSVRFAQPSGTPPRATPKPASRSGDRRQTRLRPARETVRLEDRLACLLQPSLESLMATESLAMPFEPFGYQMDGVGFLVTRRRAVVADEMGLGKTMQAITALRLLARQGEAGRVLLVCPKPLIPNWRRELATWAPELSVATIAGTPERRAWLWRHATSIVRLVGYETLVRDGELSQLGENPYDIVVIDEAQRIKNRSGAAHAAVCALPRRRSWALTGTPIENSLEDLVGLFGFVSPGVLRPGVTRRDASRVIGDSVIRRTKERVLTDLPPKLIRDETIDLAPAQREAYERAEKEGVVRLEGLDSTHELTLQHVFQLVLRLKQICNFDPATGESAKAERLCEELTECRASGRKAIVFSQWVDTLNRLETLIGDGVSRYDGRMSVRAREAELVRFREDAACHTLLMTYGAGSVGLNLQFAQYVFLFDRWWNPAVEDQAINRAHRIGAAGPVTVTRMVCAGTLEERIDAILQEKRELFSSVFPGDTSPTSAGLSKDELLSVLRSPAERRGA